MKKMTWLASLGLFAQAGLVPLAEAQMLGDYTGVSGRGIPCSLRIESVRGDSPPGYREVQLTLGGRRLTLKRDFVLPWMFTHSEPLDFVRNGENSREFLSSVSLGRRVITHDKFSPIQDGGRERAYQPADKAMIALVTKIQDGSQRPSSVTVYAAGEIKSKDGRPGGYSAPYLNCDQLQRVGP